MSLTFLTRASDGSLVIASYTGRKSYCWIWAVSVSRQKQPFHITPCSERRNQWHHFIPLPFGRTLIISRQDYHRDPKHDRFRARLNAAIERKNAERGRPLTAREKLDNLERWLSDASADTHPKDGDVKQAPLVSGAVPEGQTPKASR